MSNTKQAPSQRYYELKSLYQKMHKDRDMFDGRSLEPHIEAITKLVAQYQPKTLLDYGCGKATRYHQFKLEKKWGVKASFYDPGYEKFSRKPEGKFDAVICTDVMEHCPEEDVAWILEDLFTYANKFIYMNIACFSAQKMLPNGENAHCTIKNKSWWEALITPLKLQNPHLEVECIFEEG